MPRRKNRYVSYYDASINDQTLDNELATNTTDGLMSKEDKIKLDSISIGDGGSIELQVPASSIVPDKDNQFVTEEEKAKLDVITVTDDGTVAIPVETIVPTEEKQFVSAEQIEKWDSASLSMYYDEERECMVIL